jgi:biopolymer transport protein ExbD
MQLSETDDDLVENHDINVTPFIDVMLVLLIIFMVVAPLATVSVPIELPASNSEQTEVKTEPVIVNITKDGQYYVGKSEVTFSALPNLIKEKLAESEQESVYIQADKKIQYQELMNVMNVIREQGITQIGLMAEPEKS